MRFHRECARYLAHRLDIVNEDVEVHDGSPMDELFAYEGVTEVEIRYRNGDVVTYRRPS